MGFSGLREFIELLDREGELARVRVPVDLDQELGAVCVTSLRGRGPALLLDRNVGIYRNNGLGRGTLGILSGPYTNFMLQHRKAPAEPFPIAIAIGVDPRLVMAASCPFPFGTDELAMAGALRGRAFEVVQCKTVPLQVPADAELVLEGFLKPDEKREEGPFGEFTGHYGGLKMARPTIHLTALTRRKNPILHLAYQGAPPHETDVLTAVGQQPG